MKPTGNKLLIKKIKSEKKTGLVIVPDNSDEKFSEAEVVETGPGYFSTFGIWVPTQITKGQKVLLSKNGGIHVKTEGCDDFFLVREEEILATLT